VKLQLHETDLIGRWEDTPRGVVPDTTAQRIDWLIKHHLTEIRTGDWTVLYRDPGDGRLWELTYPHGDWHGGGPPRLTCLSLAEAQLRYGDVEDAFGT